MGRQCSDITGNVLASLIGIGINDRFWNGDYQVGCFRQEYGDVYVCKCNWNLCNGDLSIQSVLYGYLKHVDPFDMTPAMIENRERLKNISLSAADYHERLEQAISSAEFAAETHSAWVETQERKANETLHAPTNSQPHLKFVRLNILFSYQCGLIYLTTSSFR
ncbi:hypothetical protein RvY_18002 [Ramazzottius varieornatus]|uniref:Uncharacterized protein n=1 Tax=Ramazzottius varieornatus TaxID=947166 RepID=A0A1D1W4V0_RAMVA|nr:hypothetical protein RvY_18002 [Ramazzottius varieornatus]